jgi:hypothetical protein
MVVQAYTESTEPLSINYKREYCIAKEARFFGVHARTTLNYITVTTQYFAGPE